MPSPHSEGSAKKWGRRKAMRGADSPAWGLPLRGNDLPRRGVAASVQTIEAPRRAQQLIYCQSDLQPRSSAPRRPSGLQPVDAFGSQAPRIPFVCAHHSGSSAPSLVRVDREGFGFHGGNPVRRQPPIVSRERMNRCLTVSTDRAQRGGKPLKGTARISRAPGGLVGCRTGSATGSRRSVIADGAGHPVQN
jgi:hypothetical protein